MTDPKQALDEIREQLEEFALHIKPGTTKGKHRTAIFDTLELTKLVQALLQDAQNRAFGLIEYDGRYDLLSPKQRGQLIEYHRNCIKALEPAPRNPKDDKQDGGE